MLAMLATYMRRMRNNNLGLGLRAALVAGNKRWVYGLLLLLAIAYHPGSIRVTWTERIRLPHMHYSTSDHEGLGIPCREIELGCTYSCCIIKVHTLVFLRVSMKFWMWDCRWTHANWLFKV